MKKVLSGIMVASLLVSAGAMPVMSNSEYAITANAATTGTYGSLSYETDGISVLITDFDESVTKLEIPSEIENVPVTKIGNSAFENATRLESITIPKGVTQIGNNAFYQCTLLTEINLPNTLKTIGEYAFYKCISLQEINLPNSITSIGSGAFCNCVSLQEIHIPGGISTIANNTFAGCTNLKSVHIENGPNYIDYWTFYNCKSLTEIYIPLSILSISSSPIDDRAFYNCPSLTDVYYAGSQFQWNVLSGRSQFGENVKIHYGAEEIPKPLTPDVNCDGAIDASDASVILSYYAYLQTGGTGSIEEFVKA